MNSGVFYNPKHSSHIRLLNVGNDLVRHIALADSSHLLLCSSHGIYLYNYKRSGELRPLAEGELMCTDVTTDKWGDIWIASRDGIFRYSNGELSHYNHTNSSGLIHDNMRFAVRIDSTRLLVCNFMHHLGIFDLPTRSMHILNDSIPSLSSYRIMVSGLLSSDNRNAIICTQNGSFNLDIEQRQIDSIKAISPYRQYSNKFNCCYSDSRKRIWLGTQNGLLVFDSLRCHRLSESDGLSNSCIQSLAEDRYGNIWVGTSMGLNRIHIDNDSLFSIRIIDKSDGLPSSELMERCMCITPDGRLYLSTLDGLVEVDASQFVEPVDPPKVTLVSFTVGEKEMRCDNSGISLPHNENYVELKVSCLHYSHNSHTRYRYRMLGIDDDWHLSSDIGSLSVIRFNALPAGDYTFEVCASNGDDLWGHVFRKEIRIRPPFWLSWWAKLLYAVSALVVLLVSGRIYLRYRQKKIQKENEEKINRLFELRSEARHQFATSVNISPDKIGVNLEEESLVKKMIEAISANMDNVDYSVNMLASDICMSRANLYKKMQTMLGITPNEFMRNIRLKHAAQLLSSTDIPVNQISLQVGFQTPRYFSQCFKSLFGLTPSEYRNGK